MTEVVAQGCVDVTQVQDVITRRYLLGARTELKQRDDAFQRHSRLPDPDYSVRVLAKTRRFPFEGW
jgi:hypothetical protein